MVRFGPKCEEGFLPVYSVDTPEEAILLTLTCPTNVAGEFVARELINEQTLDNLEAFGERLARAHKILRKREKSTTPRKIKAPRAQKRSP